MSKTWQLPSGTLLLLFSRMLMQDHNCFDNNDAGHAYLTPDPSSQLGFSSPPHPRRALACIPVLRPKSSGEPITIGRSSVQCTHPIPQQSLNLQISRVHVVVVYNPRSTELSVLSAGLDSIYSDTSYETHKVESGAQVRFPHGQDIKINIAGYVVLVEGPEPANEALTETPSSTLHPPM